MAGLPSDPNLSFLPKAVVCMLPLRGMEVALVNNKQCIVWRKSARKKLKKPIVIFTIRAVKRCFLIRIIPNSVGLKDLYFQACVFGLVRDLLKTKPKDRPNSS